MGKLLCKCGTLLSTSEVPNEIEYRAYSDREWEEKILEKDWLETIAIPYPEHYVWRCPVCERLYVFKYGMGYGKALKVYKLEEENA